MAKERIVDRLRPLILSMCEEGPQEIKSILDEAKRRDITQLQENVVSCVHNMAANDGLLEVLEVGPRKRSGKPGSPRRVKLAAGVVIGDADKPEPTTAPEPKPQPKPEPKPQEPGDDPWDDTPWDDAEEAVTSIHAMTESISEYLEHIDQAAWAFDADRKARVATKSRIAALETRNRALEARVIEVERERDDAIHSATESLIASLRQRVEMPESSQAYRRRVEISRKSTGGHGE